GSRRARRSGSSRTPSFRGRWHAVKVSYQATVWLGESFAASPWRSEMSEIPGTLPAVVRRAAREFGDRRALVEADLTLTFSQLHDLVQSSARGYLALGLQPGG